MPSLLTVTTLSVFDIPDTPEALIDGPTCQMPAIDFIAAPVPETLPTPPAGTPRPAPFVSSPVAEANVARCYCGHAAPDHDAEGCHVADCMCDRNPAIVRVAGQRHRAPDPMPPLITAGTWVAIGVFIATAVTLVVLTLLPLAIHLPACAATGCAATDGGGHE